MSPSRPKVLLLISGSIAAYKALELLSSLKKWGAELRVVLSPGAEHFVTPASVEALSGRVPHGDLWAVGDSMAHIELAEWADLVLLYPASASTLSRLSHGLADDLIGCLSLARVPATPFWIAPAMNPKMWENPAVQASVSRLKGWGYRLIDPDSGIMACGEVGAGRLVEPERMFSEIQRWHAAESSSQPRLRWLMTSGGTREAIDSVRYLGNDSSGRTGAILAEYWLARGDAVTLIAARHAEVPAEQARLKLERYTSFAELESVLKSELSGTDYDAVAHAAAVSDYLVADPATDRKLDSQDETLNLRLTPSPKLLNQIRGWSRSERLHLTGFKLLTSASPEAVAAAIARQQAAASPDLIVYNDSAELKAGQRGGQLWKSGALHRHFESREQLAEMLRAEVLDWHETPTP
ncbi:MAG: bifunctional phosphopantothenoylcysteine decarboxylase/phosphopantothenate--cysteine ligase CoaBC [Wenzhouxiangella sp.]